MFHRDIVLEALETMCNGTLTSVQQRRSQTSFSNLPLTRLISTVTDGEQTCPVARNILSVIRNALYGEVFPAAAGLAGQIAQLKLDVDENNGRIFIVDEGDFFDPRFDYDFTGLEDRHTYYRGGEKYRRPCGWQRFALKVLDKYDGNEWLGTTNRTTQSVMGEWPVSYHGTSEQGAKGIIEGVFKPGYRERYGRGIYSTPDIDVAEGYSRSFKSKKNDKTYKVILQNRINPKYREKHITDNNEQYWLVKIEAGSSKEEEQEKVERAIRPYGLLLKEC